MPVVLLVFEYPTLNGGEFSLISMFPALRRAGYRLLATALAAGPLTDVLAQQEIDVVPWPDGMTGRSESLSRRREYLAEVLRKERPDLLHANSLAMGRLSGPVAAEANIPSLGHIRDIVKLSAAAIADLNRHNRLLSVSQAAKDFHVAQGMDASRTHVLYNGVDLSQFRPRPQTGWLCRELRIKPPATLIGVIGQIIQRKGLDLLAQAAATLADRLPQVHYVIVGSRYSEKDEARLYESNLHVAFDLAGLKDRAHFLGCRTDVPELLSEVDLLVHPARQEPLGRVLLEAGATGLPIIATDVGGTREIFPLSAAAARIIPPNDSQALAEAIVELVGDGALRRQLGEAAAVRIQTAFDVDHAAARLVEHYEKVLE
jgi:glycosyltransferase involved in cell wall biosynthesis